MALNLRQQQALNLIRADRQRDIYQGQDYRFYVSYTGGLPRNLVPTLTNADIEQMLLEGLIQLKWPEHPTVRTYVLSAQRTAAKDPTDGR